ncbi:hypothetical protein D9M73_241510 [compost metagenome]
MLAGLHTQSSNDPIKGRHSNLLTTYFTFSLFLLHVRNASIDFGYLCLMSLQHVLSLRH